MLELAIHRWGVGDPQNLTPKCHIDTTARALQTIRNRKKEMT